MKLQVGIYCNAKLVLMALDVTHKEVTRASQFEPGSLDLTSGKGEDSQLVYRLKNHKEAEIGETFVSYPFANNSNKVQVAFSVAGSQEEIKVRTARLRKFMTKIEKQIKDANKTIDAEIADIEMITEGDE